MFQESQNKEYLELCIDCAKNLGLTWIEQFLDIILDITHEKPPDCYITTRRMHNSDLLRELYKGFIVRRIS